MKFPTLVPIVGKGFSAQFFIRFLYSCIVDADFLDTERALNSEKSNLRKQKYCLKALSRKLEQYIERLCNGAQDTFVNRKRKNILLNCNEKANELPGLFTLTVPTGGGKTLSSLSFALKHAVKYGKERVIYVIPYTSIIEQNAAVFRKILGDENVLEHHSNFSYPQDNYREERAESATDIMQIIKLATENWDMPIIATTNVQFFESLFAARSSRCRKLHNLVNSVIVIDEAQMLPSEFLKPCLSSIMELITNYKSTIVLCTATQPNISKLIPEGVKTIEIIDDPAELYQDFKRVSVKNLGTISDDELEEQLALQEQVLCIVNSKKHARLLYERINGEGAYHLSTRMCPAHRTDILEQVKGRLKAGITCRVVSTQLIEAGVDIDFPVVYRSMAGIDSIAQSAGRCNREGLRPEGKVYVFMPGEKHGIPRGWLNRTATLGKRIIENHEDPLGLEGVKEYFSSLYDIDDSQLDKNNILKEIRELEAYWSFQFRAIEEKFKLIQDNTCSIIIPGMITV
ncbi:hypothetical protein N752_09450 [Desulforamulus aquiferis]|nr:hypothetical protein N752_09450 [Desulforamulus aquiferis]